MAGVSTSDKSLFQARRIVVPISEEKPPEKKKFRPGKLFPKILIGKTHVLKKIFFVNKKRGVITITVLVLLIGGGAYGYYQYLLSQNPAVIYSRKLKSITNTVSQQVSLPTDEQPVVATVTDTTKLPNEVFFKNAKDGDKILLYKKNKKAILYRPGTGQVITIAVLDFKDVTPSPAQSAVAPIKGTVAGASTSATVSNATIISVTPAVPLSPTIPYVPQGKILVQPQ